MYGISQFVHCLAVGCQRLEYLGPAAAQDKGVAKHVESAEAGLLSFSMRTS